MFKPRGTQLSLTVEAVRRTRQLVADYLHLKTAICRRLVNEFSTELGLLLSSLNARPSADHQYVTLDAFCVTIWHGMRPLADNRALSKVLRKNLGSVRNILALM